MGLFDFWRSRPALEPVVRARYDSAQSNDKNAAYWGEADLLSATASNSRMVRDMVRKRARYEFQNNSFCRGIVTTLANDTIGVGPTAQLKTASEEADDVIETAWESWCEEVCLAEKLRIMRQSLAVDGESFGVFITNPAMRNLIQLDLKLVESDQVATPEPRMLLNQEVDGIELDLRTKEPKYYHILKNHPGDLLVQQILDYDRIPAAQVVHLINRDRPGVQRGISEIQAALPLFSQLRRFTLAVLESAEAAASVAGILKTTTPPEQAAVMEPFYPVKLNRGSFIALPEGWDYGQAKTEFPNASFEMFKRELINECARCVNMPLNVALGTSERSNYASGRLDFQVYHKAIRVMRHMIERRALAKIFAAWLEEAMLIPGIVPDSAGDPASWSMRWAWDSGEHVDPLKEASAIDIRLANNTTTLATEYARFGRDWKVELRQRAAEIAYAKELGIDLTNEASRPQGEPQPAADQGE